MDDAASERVLVLAPIGRDAAAATALLTANGLAAEACTGLAEVRSGLETGAGAAVVAEEACHLEAIDALAQWVEHQPSWSDFPFLVLTAAGRGSAADRLRRRRLLDALRNVALLERPLAAMTLVSAVQAALRGRRRQYDTRRYLLERELAASRLESLVAARTAELAEANRLLRAEMADREQAEAALRQAQKMEAMGQLTGGVAHDFNNLLTAVLGNLELAAKQVTGDTPRRMLGNAERAARRGARLVEQLLAFARKQRLDPQPTDLNALVSGMRDLLFRTIGSTVRIETALAPDLWPAMVDAGQVELVLLNLAINARDAMPGGGRLTIATGNIDPATQPRPSELASGDYVRVSVGDTGTGMTPDVLAQAFEPFFTTKDVGRGTGLGLSQVYGVARQSGGTVSIDTRLGRGTTVTLYLPRADAQSAPAPREGATDCVGAGKGTILVVDDDPDVLEVTVAALEGLGYSVTACAGGRPGLEALERGTGIDLLLIDYAMPDLTGLEAARRARAIRPDLPIILMSGYADLGNVSWDRILKKPFTVGQLAASLDRALGNGAAAARSKVVPLRPATRAG